ncbi:hypothetical protein [Catellatospora paridis]|uniref:hypothetical protein n=1 Tax=Catellatospora paridis TaxID=1617086 RepID=UPI0018AFCCD4|nr:hypothetical protein [Catellatospora paridis]
MADLPEKPCRIAERAGRHGGKLVAVALDEHTVTVYDSDIRSWPSLAAARPT